jgi:hypothetical protein
VKQKLAAATFVIGFCAVIGAVFAYNQDGPDRTLAEAQYLPGYTVDGDSILPKNFYVWVYVGSPLTPNSLIGGHAAFPNIITSDSEASVSQRVRPMPAA